MIELTPIDKDEWMPRVRVLVVTSVAEAREALDELVANDIHSSINSLQIVAQRPDFAEWPEGYIVRLAWEPSAIAGWADAQLLGYEHGRQVAPRAPRHGRGARLDSARGRSVGEGGQGGPPPTDGQS